MAGRSEGQGDESRTDRRDRRDLPRADALVQDPRPHDEQHDEADREDRLHHGQGRDEESRGLEPPSGDHEQCAQEPAPAQSKAGEKRGSQRLRRGRLTSLEGLEGDPAVVERRREQSADHPERDEAHR